MGVDFYPCNSCGETFCDCGVYVGCDCGNKWCDTECAEEEGYQYNEETRDSSCSYCRKEDFEDSELLRYVLRKSGITREEIISEYKKDNGGN